MKCIRLLLILLISINTCLHAIDLQGQVVLNAFLRSLDELEPGARALLDGGKQSGLVKEDGEFVLHDLSDGAHQLDISSRHFIFDKFRIEVDTLNKTHPLVVYRVGTQGRYFNIPLSLPLRVVAIGAASYFTPQEGFSLKSMVMNPFFLMMGFTLLVVVFYPKLMKNIDPEALKELQESQKTAASWQSGTDFSQKLATMFAPSQDPASGSSKPTSSKKPSKSTKRD